MIVERRIADRFTVDLPAIAEVKSGDECTVEITNISASGIQLQVHNHVMPMLLPNIDREFKVDTVPFVLRASLPGTLGEVEIRIGIVYIKRISMVESVIGCRFEEFYNHSEIQLEQFLMSLNNTSRLMRPCQVARFPERVAAIAH